MFSSIYLKFICHCKLQENNFEWLRRGRYDHQRAVMDCSLKVKLAITETNNSHSQGKGWDPYHSSNNTT